MKTCTGCHRTLPLDAFGFRKASRDGRNYRCRACNSESAQRSRSAARPEVRIRERAKARATRRLITRHLAEFESLVRTEADAEKAGRRQETA